MDFSKTHQTISKLSDSIMCGPTEIISCFLTCVWISPGKKSPRLSSVKLTLALAGSKENCQTVVAIKEFICKRHHSKDIFCFQTHQTFSMCPLCNGQWTQYLPFNDGTRNIESSLPLEVSSWFISSVERDCNCGECREDKDLAGNRVKCLELASIC